jgi:hypothetical protein
MKKLFVLFVAVAATISLSAKTILYFSRPQFQWSAYKDVESVLAKPTGDSSDFDVQVTAPFVYKGTIALKGDWIVEPDDQKLTKSARQNAKCIIEPKVSWPAIMTLCQPCIDCYPCEAMPQNATGGAALTPILPDADDSYDGITETNTWGKPGSITNWTLYVGYDISTKKNHKVALFAKIDLLSDGAAEFFTGPKGKNLYVRYDELNSHFVLTGAKSAYTFEFFERLLGKDGEWQNTDNTATKAKAEIMSAKALNGTIYYTSVNPAHDYGTDLVGNGMYEILDLAGTVKLSRDNTLTKNAVTRSFGVEASKVSSKWSECMIDENAAFCEDYFANVFEEEYFTKAYPEKKYSDGVDWDDASVAGGFDNLFGYVFGADFVIDNFKFLKD